MKKSLDFLAFSIYNARAKKRKQNALGTEEAIARNLLSFCAPIVLGFVIYFLMVQVIKKVNFYIPHNLIFMVVEVWLVRRLRRSFKSTYSDENILKINEAYAGRVSKSQSRLIVFILMLITSVLLYAGLYLCITS